MLFKVLLLGFSLLIAFMYLGAFISVKTESFKYQFIFWILYFVTIITVAQIVACIVIFIKYYNKSGEIGPRGFEGKIGDKGDKGKCEKTVGGDKKNCGEGDLEDCDYHIRLIKVMIQKIYEKEYKRNLKDDEIRNLNSLDLEMGNIKTILGYPSNSEINKLHQLKYSDLRKLHAHITINASSKSISQCLTL